MTRDPSPMLAGDRGRSEKKQKEKQKRKTYFPPLIHYVHLAFLLPCITPTVIPPATRLHHEHG